MISALRKSSVTFLSILLAASCAKERIGSTPHEEAGIPYPVVHFPFDSHTVYKSELTHLKEDAIWLKIHKDVVVILAGHTDEWGSKEYNLALGDKRARSVKEYLVRNGISSERLPVISYGEERPVDPRHIREAWRKNRRVEFIIR